MEAILLVGGFGTRLLPLTQQVPKPLIPLVNVPFIARTLSWLHAAGVRHVIMSLHYNAEQFIAFFRSRSWEMDLSFAVEEAPLGTGGAIKYCERWLRGPRCFICNGDIFTTLSLRAMAEEHRRHRAHATIALTEVEDPSRFGVIETDGGGRVAAFTEKPPRALARSREINAGIYLFERSVFDRFPAGACSVERDIFPQLVADGVPVYGHRATYYWTDLGTPSDYLQAHRDLLARRVHLPMGVRERTPGIWMGEGVRVDAHALLRPPLVLGAGARVEAGATVGPSVVLGAGVVTEREALVEDSILWEGARVLPSSVLRGCILGRHAQVSGHLQGGVCADEQTLELS